MKEFDTSTPVVVLNVKLAALGIMRSLGKKGVDVYGVDSDPSLPAFRSRFCAGRLILDMEDEPALLDGLLEFGKQLGARPVLFWTSDETAVFCARYSRELSPAFSFPVNDLDTIDRLQDKAGMHRLAEDCGVPVPRTEFPRSEEDVLRTLDDMPLPIMVKGIIGSRLLARTGKKMQLANSREELLEFYRDMEDPDEPNLMLQEAIPGADDQVYIFNGYFDANSECLNPYTGHKLRQYPVHVGCASLGICRANEDVSRVTRDFMKAVGYRGILDIGYRLDPRDGRYKVLDVNPRIGQAFRIFVGEKNEDVARDLYLDMTGQPRESATARDGRRWMIEDYDLVSSYEYRQEGLLTIREWLASFGDVQELAWWWWRDPVPFLLMMATFLRWQIPRRIRSSFQRLVPSSLKGAKPSMGGTPELSRQEVPAGAELWATIGPAWRRVLSDVANPSPFLSSTMTEQWILACGSAMATSGLIWLDKTGEPVGCALLSKGPGHVGPFRLISCCLNTSGASVVACEHNDVLAPPAYRDAVRRDLLAAIRDSGADAFELMGATESLFTAIEADWTSAGWQGYQSESPYVDLAAIRSRDGDFLDTLSPNTRAQIRRSIRVYTQRFGPEELELASCAEESHAWFSDMVTLHDQRCRMKGRTSGFTDEGRRFHKALIERTAEGSANDDLTAELLRVRFGDATIGFLYHLVHRGYVYFYQGGLRYHEDPTLKPGLVSHAFAISHYLAHDAIEYDFLGGEDHPVQYKRSMSTHARPLYWGEIPLRTARMRVLGAARKVIRPWTTPTRHPGF